MNNGVVRWLHNPSTGRGKRPEIVKAGCYVLEHDATGRFYIGQSSDVSAEVDKQLALLAVGKHPCKLLNALYEKDNVIRVIEYPVKKASDRKRIIADIVAEVAHPYLHLK
ncbi:hypothetical protein D3C85_15540 [compost metagenome]